MKCHIVLMPRRVMPPESAWIQCLPQATLLRASTMQSEKRLADYLWNRWILWHLLALYTDKTHSYQEHPPYTPLHDDWHIAISHSAHWIGVGIGKQPFAIDLETIASRKSLPAMFERITSKAYIDQYVGDLTLPFFQHFGLYECAIKLNADWMKPSAPNTDSIPSVVLNGKILSPNFWLLPNKTLFTMSGPNLANSQFDATALQIDQVVAVTSQGMQLAPIALKQIAFITPDKTSR